MKTYIACAVTLLAAVGWTVPSQAQLDPRERYGSYFGGGQAKCVDYSVNFACNGANSE